MAWSARFADAMKQLAALVLGLMAIATELVKQTATKLDDLVDDLNSKVT